MFVVVCFLIIPKTHVFHKFNDHIDEQHNEKKPHRKK